MATGAVLTLVDLARRTDPNGETADIAELLSMADEIYDDLVWKEGNTNTGHLYTVRTSIPQGWWRYLNQGVPQMRTTTAQGRVNCGMLTGNSTIDRRLVNMAKDPKKFRYEEDNGILEGLAQTIAGTFMYGNQTANQAQFTGFSALYNTVSAVAANAANVFDGGGVGSDNASIWGIGWGPRTIYAVYPMGSKQGLDVEPISDPVDVYDASGNPYRGYRTWFEQDAGLCVEDWRYAFRVCNLDVTAAGLAGNSPYDIFAGLAKAVLRLPKMARGVSGITGTDARGEQGVIVRPAIYANRTVRAFMDIQAIRDRNVLLGPTDYAGQPITSFRGVPIRVVDKLLNTEARVV